MIYTADFETTTDPNDCRVWAVALCEVGNTNNFWYDNSIDSLMDFCYRHEKNLTLYFHNLKFDGEFIIYWLFHHGYKFVKDRKDLCTKSFTTLISDRNVFYTIKICFLKTDKEEKYVERTGNQHGGIHEIQLSGDRHTWCKHMVCPHNK